MEQLNKVVEEVKGVTETITNKPREYWIAESDGVGIHEYPCTQRFNYNGGFVFNYKDKSGRTQICLVPRKYKFHETASKIYIGKNLGNSSAAVMLGIGDILIGNSTDVDCPGEDLSLLYRTHMASMGYKSLYEKNMPWKWLIIGIAVLVVVVGVVWFIKSQQGG